MLLVPECNILHVPHHLTSVLLAGYIPGNIIPHCSRACAQLQSCMTLRILPFVSLSRCLRQSMQSWMDASYNVSICSMTAVVKWSQTVKWSQMVEWSVCPLTGLCVLPCRISLHNSTAHHGTLHVPAISLCVSHTALSMSGPGCCLFMQAGLP